MAPARKTHILRWTNTLAECSNPNVLMKYRAFSWINAKDQFSDKDLPSPSLCGKWQNRQTCCTFFTGDNFCWPAHNLFPNTVPPKVDGEWKKSQRMQRGFLYFFWLTGSGYISAFMTSVWLQTKVMWHHHCLAKRGYD